MTVHQDTDAVRVAEIYERFQEHIHLQGTLIKNDRQIWRWVDSITEQAFMDLYTFASEHQDWDADCERWVDQLAERTPFCVRLRSEQHRPCENNRLMWKMLMLFREMVQARLAAEAHSFHKHFEIQSL